MQSRKSGIVVAVLGAALAVVLFVVLASGDDDGEPESDAPATTAEQPRGGAGDGPDRERPQPPPEPELPLVEIRNGKPIGGVQELEFESGGTVRFEVRGDAADELHLHGYDRYVDVRPGKVTEVRFPADIEGVFELESHSTGELLAEIAVVPG